MPRLAVRPHPAEDDAVAIGEKTFRRRRLGERWRRLRPWVIALLLVALIGTGVWVVWFSQVMVVTGTKVTGQRLVLQDRIVRVAQVPHGVQLARVDLGAIEARVESIPAIRDADVSRAWPDKVSIAVTEREPIAVVERPASGLQAVDSEGVLFLKYAKRPKGLPLIRTAPDVRTEALAEAASVITSLRADVGAKVERLDVESVDRILLHLKDGRKVLWGSAEQSADKAEVVAALLARKVAFIDVSVPGRPVTR